MQKSFLLSDLLDLYKLHCDQCLFLQSMLSALIFLDIKALSTA